MSDLVFDGPPGAALLEGWSDEQPWRILLPWPEETRTLPWDRACDWKSFLDELTASPLSPLRGERVGVRGESGVTGAPHPGPLPGGERGLGAHAAPFVSGWVGFISYEAMACEEAVLPRAHPPPEPAAFFALHRRAVYLDDGLDRAASPGPRGTLRDSFGKGEYGRAVERIREAIRDGDVYQVNLTRSFTVPGRRDPAELYRALTAPHPPRSSAFIRGDGWSIASASPEVLLRFDRNSGIAESRPIKGTVRRGDASAVDALLGSEKDASEHLMIVDVVRNDFGKIAPPGAVSVPAFRTVQTLEHVHHLESTVRATGLRDRSLTEVLAALSPAASITGAPKRAAVQMIREAEPVPRGVYCGAIGYIDFRGHAELSVAIRTAVATEDEVRYHAGGGIVWDSDAAAEDDETRAKSLAFLKFAGVET
ncbi:MAG: anthranilate synthase component I family protein [Thermoanaerobaculia bacterium]